MKTRTLEEQASLACFELWNSGRIKSQRLEGMLIRDFEDSGESFLFRWNEDDLWSSNYEIVYSDLITVQCLLLLYREATGEEASCVRLPGGWRMYHSIFVPVGPAEKTELECIVNNLVRLAQETE